MEFLSSEIWKHYKSNPQGPHGAQQDAGGR